MKYLLRILCCSLLCAPLLCAAKDISPLVKNLKGKVVLLRGMESGDKLSFDAQGNFLGTGAPLPFAYSAVLIQKVSESSTGLELKGERVALVYIAKSSSISAKDFHYIRIAESVAIMFAADSAEPAELDAAIHKALAFTAEDDLSGSSIPDIQIALATLGITAPTGNVPNLGVPSEVRGTGAIQVPRAGQFHDGVLPPRLIYSVAPAAETVTGAAGQRGRIRFDGICIIGLVVSANGIPMNIHVVRSAKPDLDQKAIDAVKQYRFLPALREGHPVSAAIDVEVNFRIY